MTDITGRWHSHYEYPQGSDNTPQSSEHTISFVRTDGLWVGTSEQSDGSTVTISLTSEGNIFSGNWKEETAPEGHYQRRTFSGVLQLALNEHGTELKGFWLGPSSTGIIKAGSWTLQKVTE